jgi:hypothetical protein
VVTSHQVQVSGSRVWVTHRRRRYGPFDYAWSPDFTGVELLYSGEKFGEYCSREEVFADLKPFKLPRRVVQVGSIVLGAIVYGVLEGMDESARIRLLKALLETYGLSRFHLEIESSLEP